MSPTCEWCTKHSLVCEIPAGHKSCTVCAYRKRRCSLSPTATYTRKPGTQKKQPAPRKTKQRSTRNANQQSAPRPAPPTLSSRLNDIAVTVNLARQAKGAHANGVSQALHAQYTAFLHTYPDWAEWEESERTQAGPSSG
ncbi:hypothetical protein CYLTODRAFT_478740 [Cylindrobasidium torrendii FP15055 ss-10]|uniref:Zn(2)-C6 fungal-type domain-containing protein n=1 Tax=Cylindrobasidium torrendii FP15055 ss-10 TaxID=1314674 RepID=A0A0D7AVV7_9AGAR|nr:hypothetical protein CYLTODRAFT_460070 [Cylindrobasidium torrendii FP15055 ss-10]KIY61411.1 hypothetical protein CYLTODRAFT_478740 [Cylindrobasidium torrendii FP15055 ss-10]